MRRINSNYEANRFLFRIKFNSYGSGNKRKCPYCETAPFVKKINGRDAYRCPICKKHIYPKSGSLFEKSNVPTHKWFYTIFLFSENENISQKRLMKLIKIKNNKTARHLLNTIKYRLNNKCKRQCIISLIDHNVLRKNAEENGINTEELLDAYRKCANRLLFGTKDDSIMKT